MCCIVGVCVFLSAISIIRNTAAWLISRTLADSKEMAIVKPSGSILLLETAFRTTPSECPVEG